MNVSLSTYHKLLGAYVAPQRRRVIVLSLLMLADITLQLLLPRVVQTFIDSAIAGIALQTLLLIGAGYLVFALSENAIWVGWQYVSHNIGLIATNRIRADLTRHCLKLDMSFHNARTPGEMIERIDGDVTKLGTFLSEFLVQIALNGLLLVGVLFMLFSVNWLVGLPVLIGLVIAIASAAGLTRPLAKLSERERQSSAELYGFLEERLAGTEDIRANGGVAYVLRRHIGRARNLFRSTLKAHFIGMLSWRSLHTAIGIGAVCALVAGALLFLQGAVTLGQVYLIFAYTEMMAFPVEQLMRQFEDLQQATASIARVQALFEAKSVISDDPARVNATLPAGALSVELNKVSFGYPNDDLVLREVCAAVPAGGTLGLLGRTGSGKTTLTRLLLRLYDTTHGVVCLGGLDVRGVRNDDLRRRVGIVTQDIQLFSASVRDNLTFFDASVPEAQIMSALDELGMGDWARSLPQGLDTMLATGGTGLSAGEAQLLAFARVFLRDPGLVILDEASSRLDPATERKLEQAVGKLLAGRTGIIIAHRLGTVQRVDQIMILEGGQVREAGARDALARDPSSRFSQLLQAGMEEALA